jgi:MFS family permease
LPLLSESGRPTGRHAAIVAFAWATWFFGFASLLLLSFVLGPVQARFAASELALAWLTGVAIGMTAVGGVFFGWFADRFGRRSSMTVAVITIAAGNLACAAAPSFATFLAARALVGLGVGGSWGAGQALIGETFPPALRGRYGAIAQTGAPLGLGLATILGSFVAPEIGWRATFALGALPALMLAGRRLVPESDLWRPAPPIAATLAGRGVAARFASCLLLTALNMSNYWFAVTWLPRYLQTERGLSLARSGVATLAFVVGSFAGYLLFGWLSDRWGRRATFTVFCLLMAAGLLGFTVFWDFIAGEPRLVLAFLVISGIGTGTWSGYGPMLSELFPTAVRGTVLSVIMNSTRGVQFLAPVIIAAVAPRWGMAGGIALAAGFALLAAAWIWTLPETRGRAL